MADERRRVPRAPVPGMRVVFEDASGQRVEADVIDVGSGGLFIRTAAPLAVGKRLSLQVGAVAGVAEWSALGRVVWTRPTGAPGAPPGMGVTLIDVDDAVVAAVDKLVASRAHASPGKFTDEAPTAPAAPAAAGAARDVHGMPTREVVVPRMVLALATRPDAPGPPPMRARERSLVVDLVARKASAQGGEASPSSEPPPWETPRRRGVGWLLVLLAVCAAVVLYAERWRFPALQALLGEGASTAAAPAPDASGVPAGSGPATTASTASPAATTNAATNAATSATPAASVATPIVVGRTQADTAPSGRARAASPPLPASPSTSPAPPSSKPRAGTDNPY